MSITKVIPSGHDGQDRRVRQVTAPLDLLGDSAATLDFLSVEFSLAKASGNKCLEIAASATLLPLLATAAGAFDAADMPEYFRLVEE
ncbi:MAG: hypothetical protein Q4G50_00100 [Corynebacterium sp.]|uniref:hypothetical protein n=1 Tax=Corynebacterium sp. TaxID=1720 RepID=UPI0026DF99A0|nr:hypothetical protein [Corynebacterium sp.]MDO5668389.1 hypothetical protein [Corynebacterium sp.]